MSLISKSRFKKCLQGLSSPVSKLSKLLVEDWIAIDCTFDFFRLNDFISFANPFCNWLWIFRFHKLSYLAHHDITCFNDCCQRSENPFENANHGRKRHAQHKTGFWGGFFKVSIYVRSSPAPPISDNSCVFEYSGHSRLTLVIRSLGLKILVYCRARIKNSPKYSIIDVITIGLLSFSHPRCA